MKTKAPEQREGRSSLYRSATSSRAETAVFATLGLMSLIAIVVATVSGSVPARPGEDSLVRYVRSGQLAADVRTARAVVHYFFEGEPVLATDVSAPRTAQKNVTASTNDVSI